MKVVLRILVFSFLALISSKSFSQCTVVINEIMASPIGLNATNSLYDNYQSATSTGPTQNAEWIELYNPDPCNSVDISCWILGGTGEVASVSGLNVGNFTFPQGTIIPPLGFVSVGGAMSGATFTLDKYWQTSNFCMQSRWYLRDTRCYVMLSDANGNIVDAVYWGTSASDINNYPANFGSANTTSCACNLPQGPGTKSYSFPAASAIPGIEYVGDNYTANGSPTTTKNPLGYTMKRQQDGSPVWVINGNNSLNACNANCYSLTVNNVTANAACNQTASATGTHTITGYSHAPYTYSWSNGTTGATATGLTAGTYTYTVTDVCGCSKTGTAQVTQVAGFVTNVQSTDATCSILGTATATNTGGSSSSYTYSWNTNPVQTTQTATGLLGGTYSVSVNDANGCTNTASVTINQSGGVSLSSSVINATCNPDGSATVNATGGSGIYTYSWSNGQTSTSATGLTAGTYTVSVNDGNGCSSTTTATITQPTNISFSLISTPSTCATPGTANVSIAAGTSPYTYSWSNGTTQQNASSLSGGTYTLTVTDANFCSASQSVTVDQVGGVDILLSQPDTICPGVTISISATSTSGTAPYIYSWSNGAIGTSISVTPVSNSTYSATVTDANGCSSSKQLQVVVLNNPLSLTSVNPAGVCEGQNVSLSVTPVGGNTPLTYSWSDAGQTSTSIQVSPLSNSTYTVTATDACGITASSIISVVINPIPVPNFSMIIPKDCKTVCVSFSDSSVVQNGNIIAWEWDFGDKATSDEQHPVHCYSQTNNYNISLTVTSNNSCMATYSTLANVVIDATPIANFDASTYTIVLTDKAEVNFTNQTIGGITYSWNFGDSINQEKNISDETNPMHVYTQPGVYCINLVSSNALGCKDSLEKCIEVIPDWTLYVPNTFTPNSNGNNDVFAPVYSNVSEINLWIYDRWGNKIFYGKNAEAIWDGKVQNGSSNEIAQLDTYVWVLTFTDIFDKPHRQIGHVNLIK